MLHMEYAHMMLQVTHAVWQRDRGEAGGGQVYQRREFEPVGWLESSGGDGGQTTVKVLSVMDYQGSASHYLHFITAYIRKQEVRSTRYVQHISLRCVRVLCV